MDGRLEAAHMFHGGAVCFHRLHVLVQDGKNLIVQDLVLPNSICHLLQGLQKETGLCRLGAGKGDRGMKQAEKNSARSGFRVQGPDASSLSSLETFYGFPELGNQNFGHKILCEFQNLL